MAFGAQCVTFTIGFVRVCTGGAVGRVAGKCFHDIELVVVGETRIRYNFLTSERTIRGRKNAYLSIFSYSIVRKRSFSLEGFGRMKLWFSEIGCRLLFFFV